MKMFYKVNYAYYTNAFTCITKMPSQQAASVSYIYCLCKLHGVSVILKPLCVRCLLREMNEQRGKHSLTESTFLKWINLSPHKKMTYPR